MDFDTCQYGLPPIYSQAELILEPFFLFKKLSQVVINVSLISKT